MRHLEEVDSLSRKLKKVIRKEYKEVVAAALAKNSETMPVAVLLNTLLIMVDDLIELTVKPWPAEVVALKDAIVPVVGRTILACCSTEEIVEIMQDKKGR
jgi:hypothetical protein